MKILISGKNQLETLTTLNLQIEIWKRVPVGQQGRDENFSYKEGVT